jgi:hypothetical protein
MLYLLVFRHISAWRNRLSSGSPVKGKIRLFFGEVPVLKLPINENAALIMLCNDIDLLCENMRLNPFLSNVEFNSTALSVLIGPMSSTNRRIIHVAQYLGQLFLCSCFLMAAFELRRLEITCEINVTQTVGSSNNNQDYESLICTKLVVQSRN